MQNTLKASASPHFVSPEIIDPLLLAIAERIKKGGDKSYVTVQYQLALLKQLASFDLGRFLLQHQEVNDYWMHYILTKNKRSERPSELESFLLDKAPIFVAMQQRFAWVLQENQKEVKNGTRLACIPSGMMTELLCLDYAGVELIELVGFDQDRQTLNDAIDVARERRLVNCLELVQGDVWKLDYNARFDLISSQGLTVYEACEKKIAELYQRFYKALKWGGKLVTSFLTPPPGLSERSEWQMSKINQDDLILQNILMNNIIQMKTPIYYSSAWTKKQLKDVGFGDIHFFYDEASMYPTVIAYK
jgi:hypothetical protein